MHGKRLPYPYPSFALLAVGVLSAEAAMPEQHAAGIELPPGEGRGILEASCLGCHDLGGLSAYAGYYDAERWRALIVTMVDHGAELDEAQIALLTNYLVEHFGPKDRSADEPKGE